ncbi:MAG: hypothetical protein U5N58_02700 [Actinomycetota bacterium]|nr:hypothetical protein [Actinomycetota bacterium]
MYKWNGIKINVEGNAHDFISQIRKYFYAEYIAASNQDYDINVSINISNQKSFMPP